MMYVENKATDLKIKYGVSTYEKIEDLFEINDGELPHFHFMLSLMGYYANNKINLDKEDPRSQKTHDFSLRTIYYKNAYELDAYYGLLTILDNLNLPYDKVINELAFERTGMNNKSFTKMTNVKTFYEFMLGGIDFFEETFFAYGTNPVEVADSIYEFLTNDNSNINEILAELLIQEDED